MTAARFTVLLPVHRPPDLLPFAVQSVLQQRNVDFELFIVCDGAPPETVECGKAFSQQDSRVRVFAFDKGERHGELHRHTALSEATAPFVAQIGDDDLWFPNYLASLGRLLERVDFGNLLQACLLPDGGIHVYTGNLADPAFRERMLYESFNFFGPSAVGYRLAAYRDLPIGWSPAPDNLWTDLHMWRKFLERTDLIFGTTFAIEGAKLSAQDRASMSLTERATELAVAAERFAHSQERRAFRESAFKSMWQSFQRMARTATQAQLAAEAETSALAEKLAVAALEKGSLESELNALLKGREPPVAG